MTSDNQNVQLVVRDIFDESVFFQSYYRNFSKTGVLADALISAVFLNENTLQITYLSGDEFENVEETLVLSSRDRGQLEKSGDGSLIKKGKI